MCYKSKNVFDVKVVLLFKYKGKLLFNYNAELF